METLVTTNLTLYAGWERNYSKYGYVEPAKGTDICGYGKDADELMENVNVVSTQNENEFRATGELLYVHDYSGFQGSLGQEKQGYFLALTYTLPSNLANPKNAELKVKHLSETTYSRFTEDDLTYTHVFKIDSSNKTTDIIFTIDLDGEDSDRYLPTELVIDISTISFGEVTVVSKDVTTEAELAEALATPNVTDVVVKNAITLSKEKTYESVGKRKTVTVSAPLTLADESTVTIKNLDFKTPDKTIVSNLIASNANKTKNFTFEGNTVTGAFACVLPDILSGTVTIKDNEFTNTYTEDGGFEGDIGNNTCLTTREHEGTYVVTGNTFDQYSTAVTYYVTAPIEFTKNKFLDNDKDILGGSNESVSDYSYNYFKDGPVIVDAFYVIDPVYTDEACKTLSENTSNDAFLKVTSKNAAYTYIRTLSLSDTLYLKNDTDELTVTVIPKDARDTVQITGGTAAADQENTVTANKDVTALSITVGDGEAKSVAIAQSAASVEADIYISTDKAAVTGKNETALLELTEQFPGETSVTYAAEKSLKALKDSDTLYVGIYPKDQYQQVDEIGFTNDKGTFGFALENNMTAIPGSVLNGVYDDYGYMNFALSMETPQKTAFYKISFTEVTANNTPVWNPEDIVGTYTSDSVAGISIEITKDGENVVSRIAGEVTSTGDPTTAGSLNATHFYNANGEKQYTQIKAGYGVNLYLNVGADMLTTTEAKSVKIEGGSVEIPAGTVFGKKVMPSV